MGKTVLFSRENAREMQRRGAEKIRKNRETLERRLKLLDEMLAAQAIATAKALVPPAEKTEEPDKYNLERRERVKKQLDRIDEMMMTEKDPAKLDRLAAAQHRLSEQERFLSMRPSPGSIKPTTEKTPRRSPPAQPMSPL